MLSSEPKLHPFPQSSIVHFLLLRQVSEHDTFAGRLLKPKRREAMRKSGWASRPQPSSSDCLLLVTICQARSFVVRFTSFDHFARFGGLANGCEDPNNTEIKLRRSLVISQAARIVSPSRQGASLSYSGFRPNDCEHSEKKVIGLTFPFFYLQGAKSK